ncbi:MAG TPA: hypothetical protein PLZ52_06640 [Bacteroidales bacterium]|nr:hypothetical protein [Bacteroidales bacterium]HQL70870.1 hypothetical protein [Bacteroidales bacterium]
MKFRLLVIVVVLFYPLSVSTQTQNNSILSPLKGSVRAWASVGWEQYDIPAALAEVSLRGDFGQDKACNARFDVRFRSGYQYGQFQNIPEIREAYAGYSSRNFDVSLGRKVLDWSRSDYNSVANPVMPANYFFISAEPDDSKMSQWMLHTTVKIADRLKWQLVAIPFYTPSVYRFDLFDMGDNVSFNDAAEPEPGFRNASYATRLSLDMNAFSAGFTAFTGYSPTYGFNLHSIDFFSDPMQVYLIPVYHRQTMLAFDAEVPAKTMIFKWEIAYNHILDTAINMAYPVDGFHGNLSVEKSFVGVQTILQYSSHFAPGFEALPEPAHNLEAMINTMVNFNRMIFYQQKKYTHGVSLLLSKNFLYESLHTELALGYQISTREWIIRPLITYSVNDNVNLSLGAMLLFGPEETLNDYASKVLNAAFLQIKTTF